MTAPSTCLPRKSSADLRSDFRKTEVTSVTVKTLSAGNGSDRGVGTCEAAGQVLVCNLCGQYKQEAIEVDIVVHKLFDVRVNHGRRGGRGRRNCCSGEEKATSTYSGSSAVSASRTSSGLDAVVSKGTRTGHGQG